MPKRDTPVYQQDGEIYADCGKCSQREWCPLFLIAVKPRVAQIIQQSNGNIEDAYVKSILVRNISKSYIDGGVSSFLKAKKDDLLPEELPYNEGRLYLASKLQEDGVIRSLRMAIMQEEELRQ